MKLIQGWAQMCTLQGSLPSKASTSCCLQMYCGPSPAWAVTEAMLDAAGWLSCSVQQCGPPCELLGCPWHQALGSHLHSTQQPIRRNIQRSLFLFATDTLCMLARVVHSSTTVLGN